MEDRILKTGVNKKSSHWNSGAVHRGASKRAFRDSAVPGNAFPEKLLPGNVRKPLLL